MGTSGAPASAHRSRRESLVPVPVWARLGWRELRAHRVRALVAALMIGVPVLVLSAATTVLFTYETSSAEAVPRDMGTTAAAVSYSGNHRMEQDVVGDQTSSQAAPATAIPGVPSGSAPSSAALQRLTGGRVLPVTGFGARADLGGRRPNIGALGIDGRDAAHAGMATLTSGRWPSTPDEVLVSQVGSHLGLPESGTVRLSGGDLTQARTVTVVGTAFTPGRQALVTLPSLGEQTALLVQRDHPVSWAEVRELNAHGLIVKSRSVMNDPSQAAGAALDYGGNGFGPTLTMLVTGLAIVMVLLTAPAFGMSGDRQQRLLAQLSSNGAQPSVLRRVVLTQGVIVGALTAVVAVIAGACAGLAVAGWLQHRSPTTIWGPMEIPLGWLTVIMGGTVLVALLAATVPAIRAGRVRVIAALRGHVSPGRVHPGWPLLGLATLVGGSLLTLVGMRPGQHETTPVAGMVLLFVGALTALPWVLSRLGRLARFLPLSGRIAVRDLGRQRGRAAAGVAAVLGVVALLTTVSITGTSDDAQARRDYLPEAPPGYAVLTGTPADLQQARTGVVPRVPGTRADVISAIGNEQAALGGTYRDGGLPPDPQSDSRSFTAVERRPGCSVLESVSDRGDGSCFSPTLLVMPPALARAYVGLDEATTRRFAEVGVLRVNAGPWPLWPGDPLPQVEPGRSGPVDLRWGTSTSRDDEVTGFRQAGQRTLPTVDAVAARTAAVRANGLPIVLTPQKARELGVPTTTTLVMVTAAGGITEGQTRALSEQVADTVYVHRETGPRNVMQTLLRILAGLAAAVVLVAVLLGALSLHAESRAERTTLAAVGAAPSVQRRIGAARAAAIGLIGGVGGMLLGIVPGIAISHPLTTNTGNAAVVEIPWGRLLVVVLAVPALAAAVTAAVSGGRPELTRRAAA